MRRYAGCRWLACVWPSLVTAVVLACLGAPPARAGAVTWTGATDTNFENAGNWNNPGNPGNPPANDTTTDVATLSGAVAANQPRLTVDRSIAGVDIQSAGWTIMNTGTTSVLTLGAGGISSAGAGTNAVGASTTGSGYGRLRLGVDSTWTLGVGNTLQLNSGIYFGSRQLTVAAPGGAATLYLYMGGLSSKGTSSSALRIQNNATVKMCSLYGNQIPDLTDVIVETGGTYWLDNRSDAIGSLSGGGTFKQTGGGEYRHLIVGTNDKNTTFSGQLTGGTVTNDRQRSLFGKRGTGTLTLTGAAGPQSFIGILHVYSGTLALSDNAQFLNASNTYYTANLFGGTLTLDNAGTNVNNRLGSSGGPPPLSRPVLLSGGEFKIIGNLGASTTETLGTMTVGGTMAVPAVAGDWAKTYGSGGSSIVTVDSDGTCDVTVQAANLEQFRGATALVRGTHLGQDLGAGFAKIKFTTPPILPQPPVGSGTPQVPILPYLIGDNSKSGTGTDFVTYDTNGLRLLTALEYNSTPASISSGPANNVIVLNPQIIGGPTTVSSLILAGGGSVGSAGGQQVLTIGSGALMSKVGNTGLGVDLAFGAKEAIFQALGNLAVNGVVSGSGGLTKSGAGTLTLNTAATVTGGVTMNAGTLKLAGGNNTLPAQALLMKGGTLDLNGTSESFTDFGRLFKTTSNNDMWALQNSMESTHDGYIGNTAAGPATLNLNVSTPIPGTTTSNVSRPFTGQIQDNINLVKTGNATLVLFGDNTYTGTTTITGAGGLALWSPARLSGTSAITLNFAPFSFEQARGYEGAINSIKDTAPITSNGGTLSYAGNANADVSETIGVVTAQSGQSTISVAGVGFINGTTTLSMSGLVRNPGASVNFTGTNLGVAGSIYPRTTISGQAPTSFMGGWATVNGADFAKYDATLGVQPLVGGDYDGGNEDAWTYPTCNAKPVASQILTAPRTINSLNLSGAASSINLNGNTLRLISGGLVISGINGTVSGGVLTAGASPGELLIYTNTGNTLTVTSTIADNPLGGAVTLVKSGAGTLVLTPAGVSSFTGGMYLNAGTVNFARADTFTGLLTVAPNATGVIVVTEALADGLNVSLLHADTLYGKLTMTQSDTISTLMLDGVYQPAGLYSATAKPPGAEPNYLNYFGTWGTNMTLTVLFNEPPVQAIPEPATLGLVLLAAPLLRRRRA